MKTNIVFLDVDGVLNTAESRSFDILRMTPSRVRNLESLLRLTSSKFILSSVWRFDINEFWNQLNLSCNESGDIRFSFFQERFLGITPDLDFKNRELEVLSSLEELLESLAINKFIALDDNPIGDNNIKLFPTNPNWLIETDDNFGFDNLKLQEALNKFK